MWIKKIWWKRTSRERTTQPRRDQASKEFLCPLHQSAKVLPLPREGRRFAPPSIIIFREKDAVFESCNWDGLKSGRSVAACIVSLFYPLPLPLSSSKTTERKGDFFFVFNFPSLWWNVIRSVWTFSSLRKLNKPHWKTEWTARINGRGLWNLR